MNRIILMGRLTAEPDLKYSSKDASMAIVRYSLAVDRKFAKKEDGSKATDFIRCVAFGNAAVFASKYFHKGQKVLVSGRIQTGSYTNKDGQKVYTTDVILEDQEFAESKKEGTVSTTKDSVYDGFNDIEGSTTDDVLFGE